MLKDPLLARLVTIQCRLFGVVSLQSELHSYLVAGSDEDLVG
jgi:hypothetical protein